VKFLDEFGFRPRQDRPIRLPAALLLGLGIGMRLLRFEEAGLTEHLECGLPSAKQVLSIAIRAGTEGGPLRDVVALLYSRLTRFLESQTVWSAMVVLGAEMMVSDVDEAALVNELAEFLWARRRAQEDK
jgi:hypothetical protein